jgi:hypothetical protein
MTDGPAVVSHAALAPGQADWCDEATSKRSVLKMAVLIEAGAVVVEADVVLGDFEPALRPSEPMFTPWACGLHDDAIACDDDRCKDIMPELMVELI